MDGDHSGLSRRGFGQRLGQVAAASTLAIAGDSECHVTGTPSRGIPVPVYVDASRRTLAPVTIGAASGVIWTRATCCGLTRTVAHPGLPFTIAPTRNSPGA